MNAKERDRAEALETLRGLVSPGDTVYTILRHVSRSGMLRVIDAVVMEPDGPRPVGYLAARVLGERWDRDRGGVRMGGCGMDMGFALVYALSSALYPDGFGCIGEGAERGDRCPSNDHANGDRDYTPHGTDTAHLHGIDCYAKSADGRPLAYTPCRRDGLDRNLKNMKEVDFGGPSRDVRKGLTLVCTEPSTVQHWHKEGGYALRQRWL